MYEHGKYAGKAEVALVFLPSLHPIHQCLESIVSDSIIVRWNSRRSF